MSSTSDSTVNLANGGFACDTSLPHYWRMLVIFCVSPCDSISSSGSVIGNRALCAGSVAGQHCLVRGGFCADYVKFASPSCVCFISFGFLLATICVWVWMVCSLHSVTTGSRDRANVSLIKQEISPYPRFSLLQVNGYTFESKKNICGTTSVPIESLHKAPKTPPRGLRGQASRRASSTRQSDASQGACV